MERLDSKSIIEILEKFGTSVKDLIQSLKIISENGLDVLIENHMSEVFLIYTHCYNLLAQLECSDFASVDNILQASRCEDVVTATNAYFNTIVDWDRFVADLDRKYIEELRKTEVHARQIRNDASFELEDLLGGVTNMKDICKNNRFTWAVYMRKFAWLSWCHHLIQLESVKVVVHICWFIYFKILYRYV